MRSSHKVAGARERGRIALHGTRQPEVHDHRVALLIHQNVGRLDVPVNDSGAMRGVERTSDFLNQCDGLFGGEIADPLIERLTSNEAHRQIGVSVDRACVMHHADPRMIQPRHRFHFTGHRRWHSPIGPSERTGKYLECHAPPHVLVESFVDDALPTFADHLEQSIVAQALHLCAGIVNDARILGTNLLCDSRETIEVVLDLKNAAVLAILNQLLQEREHSSLTGGIVRGHDSEG